MTNAKKPTAAMGPCRECGAECRIENFEGPHIQGRVSLWVCSNHKRFGGDCPSDLAYFDADAWNSRTEPAAPVEDGECDSGMSGDAVARAEMAWANLPVGNRPWTSLATHEKALVCHTLFRLASQPPAADALVSAAENAVRELDALCTAVELVGRGDLRDPIQTDIVEPLRTALAKLQGGV